MELLRQHKFLFTFIWLMIILPSPLVAIPEHIVFGIKTEIAMSAKDTPRKDYYLNLGTNEGVKQGTILEVYRTVTTTDDINNRSAKNIVFKVGRLKVIHAETDVAVGRLIEIFPPKDIPIGLFPTIIVGDRVAVSSK